ncbi:phage tail sheath subtilisin-like domain-containing protein [Nocardioides bigeumensis]|uniref:Phage tail sheath family protein n=1 Tax=Nocardioides bigeumensis TaxID=433657 RepID=A0ABN2YAQ4_9ACTN
MPEYLAPGVFVEETSFRQKTIEGVGTSTAAFVGPTRFGPIDGVPEMLTSFGDFERIYAGVDRLNGGAVDNYMAHGVRAFFENGGRRCYVARVRHSADDDDEGFGQTTIPATASAADQRLVLRARHPGRAGNFQVQLGLRLGPNILDRGGAQPSLRGGPTLEHQVVLLAAVSDSGVVRTGQFAQLRRVFDDAAQEWTFDLRSSAANNVDADGNRTFGLVSQLTADTVDVRVLIVDVEAGPLGEFMDPVFYGGLGLHGEGRNSIQQVFAAPPDASRSTELFVPLVVATENIADGAALARLLVLESGEAAGITGAAYVVTLDEAVGGTVAISVGGGAAVDVAFNATGAQVGAALAIPGAVVTGPAGGPWTIALPNNDVVTADPADLAGRGRVHIEEATVWDVLPNGADFRITIGGQTTQLLRSNASADAVDDALEEILPDGTRARVERSTAGPLTFAITIPGGHGVPLSASPSTVTVAAAAPVTFVTVEAAGGDFTFTGPADTTADIDSTDEAAIAAGLETAFGLAAPPVAVNGEFEVELEAPVTPGPLTADESRLEAAPGTAEVTVARTSSSLSSQGASRPIRARLVGGSDGDWPDGDGYTGDDGLRKSGLFALSDLPDVSIVCAPGSTQDFAADRLSVIDRVGRVIRHCENMRYRIAVIDSPPQQLPGEVRDFRGEFDSKHAALYYPWITAYDAVTRGPVSLPPSGFVAGIYARNDRERGVHKAPANETIALSLGFETHVNTAQQELLNPLAVNCLRHLDQRGRRVWGARTMTSDPEWKYVNLRRYFAFLEASIDRGTQWAVFEPNGELLWDNVRRTVEDFLMNEFASGHLLGSTPEESFFVRCDRSTMTQNDLDNGRLVCLIGVAPLRPAEFVIFRIGQKTLDVQS